MDVWRREGATQGMHVLFERGVWHYLVWGGWEKINSNFFFKQHILVQFINKMWRFAYLNIIWKQSAKGYERRIREIFKKIWQLLIACIYSLYIFCHIFRYFEHKLAQCDICKGHFFCSITPRRVWCAMPINISKSHEETSSSLEVENVRLSWSLLSLLQSLEAKKIRLWPLWKTLSRQFYELIFLNHNDKRVEHTSRM